VLEHARKTQFLFLASAECVEGLLTHQALRNLDHLLQVTLFQQLLGFGLPVPQLVEVFKFLGLNYLFQECAVKHVRVLCDAEDLSIVRSTDFAFVEPPYVCDDPEDAALAATAFAHYHDTIKSDYLQIEVTQDGGAC